MSVDEVLGAQASWSKRFGSSATGGYQFMRATLQDLKRELSLRGSQIFDPDLQDRLGFHLLKRRGYEAFMAGQINRVEFGKRLAQEWASFPVLADVQGAHRKLTRGQSFYTGDPLNKALVSPEELERVLDEAKELGDAMPAPLPVPEPRPEPVLTPDPAPAQPPPAPIGHNGGPVLEPVPAPATKPAEERPANPSPTPIEQSSKAVGAGKWAALAGAIWTVVVAADVLPAQFATPAFTAAVTALVAAVAGTVGAYMAPANAVPGKA